MPQPLYNIIVAPNRSVQNLVALILLERSAGTLGQARAKSFAM